MLSALVSFTLSSCLQLITTIMLYCLNYFVDCFLSFCKLWHVFSCFSVLYFFNKTESHECQMVNVCLQFKSFCGLEVVVTSVIFSACFCACVLITDVLVLEITKLYFYEFICCKGLCTCIWYLVRITSFFSYYFFMFDFLFFKNYSFFRTFLNLFILEIYLIYKREGWQTFNVHC